MRAEEQALNATYVTMDQLLSQSDIISINCPMNDQTRGLLSDNEFAKMKDGVLSINTATLGGDFLSYTLKCALSMREEDKWICAEPSGRHYRRISPHPCFVFWKCPPGRS